MISELKHSEINGIIKIYEEIYPISPRKFYILHVSKKVQYGKW